MNRTLLVILALFCTSLLTAQAPPSLSLSPSLKGISLIVVKIPKAHILLTSGSESVMNIRGSVSSDTATPCKNQCTLEAKAEEDILTITPFFPRGKTCRHLRRHIWFDVEITIPADIDARFEVTYGDVAIDGPFRRNLIVKLRDGLITYHLSRTPPHVLEAKAVFGKVTSTVPDVLPRPYFPFGKRLFVLTPDGKGSVYLRTTKGKIGIEP